MWHLGKWVSGGLGSAGGWLDSIILETFSNPNDSVVHQDLVKVNMKKELEPGEYNIFLKLIDAQGKDQITPVRAQVCSCEGPAKNCERRAYIAGGMGVPAILGILGGILALLSEYPGMRMGGTECGSPSPCYPDTPFLCLQSSCCCCCSL